MQCVRSYGEPPYRVAVLHGGPGAAGEVAPVVRELSRHVAVLEPLQTASSVEGQVCELYQVLRAHAMPPVTLVGYSWGAWLAYLTAAQHPEVVGKLILVSSGAFQSRYADGLMTTRISRLSPSEREELQAVQAAMEDPNADMHDGALVRFGALMSKADSYDPIGEEPEADVDVRLDIFQAVWPEADQLRRSGQLLQLGHFIECPVVAIHGAYDPTPAQGVKQPLGSVLHDFRFILLERCGHTPWIERQARDKFYDVLKRELLYG